MFSVFSHNSQHVTYRTISGSTTVLRLAAGVLGWPVAPPVWCRNQECLQLYLLSHARLHGDHRQAQLDLHPPAITALTPSLSYRLRQSSSQFKLRVFLRIFVAKKVGCRRDKKTKGKRVTVKLLAKDLVTVVREVQSVLSICVIMNFKHECKYDLTYTDTIILKRPL